MFHKKHLSLILGFSIPIVMIIFVAASIYIPGLFVHPKFNFLYTTNQYYYDNRYIVNNGRLIYNPPSSDQYYDSSQVSGLTELYLHNVITNESTQISYEQAQDLQLDSSTESPDGFKVENGNESSGFLFFGYSGDDSSEYLVGHNVSKKLNINTDTSTYDYPIHFLGWVIQ